MDVLDLRYVVAFLNDGTSKATWVNYRGQICTYDPVKFIGEIGSSA